MNTRDIRAAVQAAERFRACARAVMAERHDADGYAAGTRASGALRRASLDLTRALADMRHPYCTTERDAS